MNFILFVSTIFSRCSKNCQGKEGQYVCGYTPVGFNCKTQKCINQSSFGRKYRILKHNDMATFDFVQDRCTIWLNEDRTIKRGVCN